MLEAIGVGLREGARMAGISVSGGEIVQLEDLVKGFDLVGVAAGRVDLDKVLYGGDCRDRRSQKRCPRQRIVAGAQSVLR
jgi:phosphoribosylaminoimidazole (AIR) synthetase